MRNRKNRKPRDIKFNTTALPDIVFMLLFFFMVVTVMKDNTSERAVELPYTQYADYIKSQDAYVLIVIEQSEVGELKYYIENKLHSNLKSVDNHLAKLRTDHIADPDISVKIKIDKYTSMKYVNEMKSLLQDNSFFKVKYLIKNMEV